MNEKVDSVTLTAVIDRCLDASMDGRFTQAQRGKFLTIAKRLRGSLLNLLSARFTADTPGLQEANDDLQAVNQRLKKEADTLAKAAQTLADLTRLVGALDKLLGVAGKFL
jgi:hypothetical protein